MAWAEIAGLAVSALGTAGNMVATGQMNKKTRQWQTDENNKNRANQWEMFNATNAYNSPVEQMKRLKAAGINPHLAYSNGGQMSEAKATNPSSGGGSWNPQAPQADVTPIMNALFMKAQIDNLNSQTTKNLKDAENTGVSTDTARLELENKVNQIDQENQIRDVQIQAGKAGIELTHEQVEKTKQEVINLVTTNDEIKGKIDLMVSQKGLNDQQKANLVANLSVIYATYKNIQADTALKGSQKKLTEEQVNTQIATQSNINADTANKGEMLKSLQRGNLVGDKYDLTNAENDMKFKSANAERAVNLVIQSDTQNKLLDKQVTAQDYKNTILLFEAGSAPFESLGRSVEGAMKVIPKPATGGATTTTTFDRNGNYSGHRTTRRH